MYYINIESENSNSGLIIILLLDAHIKNLSKVLQRSPNVSLIFVLLYGVIELC